MRAKARRRNPPGQNDSDPRIQGGKPIGTVAPASDPAPFDQALSKYLSLVETVRITDQLDDPAFALILDDAKSSRAKMNAANLLIAPGAALAAGGALSFVKDKSYKGLGFSLLGGLALAPTLWLRFNRSEAALSRLLTLTSPKKRRLLFGIFQFKGALERGDILAYERTTYASGKERFRQLDPSMFHADHATAALIGGIEFWSCVKLNTSLKHRAPTSEMLFDIGGHRSPVYVDGKLLAELSLAQFERANAIITSSPACSKTLLKHLKHIELFRSLDPGGFPRLEDKIDAVAKMNGVGVGVSSLKQLVNGNLEHFESKLRQIEFPANF